MKETLSRFELERKTLIYRGFVHIKLYWLYRKNKHHKTLCSGIVFIIIFPLLQLTFLLV